MRSQALSVSILLLLNSSAFGQSYDMTIHLRNGETVSLSHDDIQRIEFAHIPNGLQDPDPEEPGRAPRVFLLLQNYPNPFNPSTTIEYEIPDMADVTVRIYGLQGALIKELLHETQAEGRHHVTWDGTDSERMRVSSGVYFYTVECGKRTLSKKLILVK
jgi:hypothetical protein